MCLLKISLKQRVVEFERFIRIYIFSNTITMADNTCFICNETLSNGAIVTVERGLETVRNASVERDDGHINYLRSVNSVTVHVECRKNYTCLLYTSRCV